MGIFGEALAADKASTEINLLASKSNTSVRF